MRGEFIDVGGRRLYYYAAGTRGAGNPIVLVHGYPTSSHLWDKLVPLLPSGYRVVVMDLLGFGRSDPPGNADLSIHGHARRLIGLMDALGIQRATLVGHQMGGVIAQALASGWPARVDRLALLHSMGFDATVTGTLAAARAVLPLMRLLPARTWLGLVRREMERWYADPYRGRHSIDQYLRPFQRGGHRWLIRQLASLDPRETEAIATSLTGVRQPVSILAGSDDPAIPATVAARLQRALPQATLDFVDEVRHFSPEEAPERVARTIDQLLVR
jgi:pimeloyl-ACP methyl ester carboxylesterase